MKMHISFDPEIIILEICFARNIKAAVLNDICLNIFIVSLSVKVKKLEITSIKRESWSNQ